MKELPVSSQMQASGGFVLPFVITLVAVAGAANVYNVLKKHYSITRGR